MKDEIKKRLAVWLYPSTEQRMTEALERLDYKSPSEFIERRSSIISAISKHAERRFIFPC